jgi:hypothetical protein
MVNPQTGSALYVISYTGIAAVRHADR